MPRPCAVAVAVLLSSVGAGAAPAPAPVPLAIQGTIVGYVGALQGLSSSTCPSTYPAKPSTPCSLKSFQAYDPPMQSPIFYGDRIIFQTAQEYSSKSTFISVSRTLQNTSTRSVDFIADCNMSLAPQTQWYNYGPVVLPPVPHATPHGGGELRPTTRDQQMQVIGYAKTDHQNSSVLVYDLDLSDAQTCSATPAAQAHLALGTDNASYLTCATRADAVEDNATGVVRSTHHALVQHDWSMGECKGVDSRGTSTCLQLVTLTSFSNGSALDPVVTNVYGWPDGLEFSPMAPYSAGSVGCYHDDASGALMIMGVYRTNNPALVRIDGLRSNNPSVVIVRTLDYPEVHPMPGSLVNVDGNVGFISLSNFLVYSTHGDFLRNKTLAVLPPGTSGIPFNGPTPMRMVTYIPA